MRAMKRTVSVLLSLMLVLGMMTIGISAAGAAETNQITVTSNIASDQVVEYSATSEQVTVTYNLQSDLTIVDVQGVVTFDTAVLKLADSNTAASIAPNIDANRTVNLEEAKLAEGRIPFNGSDIDAGYDFATSKALVTVVFDIIGTGNATVNLDLAVLVGNTGTENLLHENDVDIVDTQNGIKDTTKFASTTDVQVTPEEEELVAFSTFLYQYRTKLDGKVSLTYRFKKRVSGYDTSKLSVKFSGPAELTDMNQTVAYTDLTSFSGALYEYNYQVWSPMFSQDITCEVMLDGKVIARDTYSIEKYILDKAAETTDAKAAALNNALLNFGAKAQAQFNMYTDAPADRGIDYTMPTVTADDIILSEGEGVKPDLSDIGLTYYTEAGTYQAATNINVRYRVTNKTKFAEAGNAITIDDAASTLTNYNAAGSVQQVTIPDINSALLDHAYTITFSNGATYKTSVMAQIKTRLTATPSDEFAMAVYWYNQAANDYFGL